MTSRAAAFARESFAWEKATGTFSESIVRDPQTLELGVGMLDATLACKRAFDEAAQRAWPEWIALASQPPR